MSFEHKRLTFALLLSLLIHALLLSLTFGGEGHWLPGFGFPWQDRRIEVPDLRVMVVPAQVTAAESPVAEPMPQARDAQPAASVPALTPSVSSAPTSRQPAAVAVSEAKPKSEANPTEEVNPKEEASPKVEANPKAEANPTTDAATGTAPADMPLRADRPGGIASPPIPAPAVIALKRTDEDTWVVPPPPPIPTPFIAAAPSTSGPETAVPSLQDAGNAAQARIDQEARERAVELAKLARSEQEAQLKAEQLEAATKDAARRESARVENARLAVERLEVARQTADQQEAARQVAARQEAALLDATRQAADLQDSARKMAARQEAALQQTERLETDRQVAVRQATALQESAQMEAAKVEAAKVDAAKVEAAKVEAAKVEAAKVEAAKVEAAKVEAARVEAARVQAAQLDVVQEAAARREATLRAIGRQLDEEAARREAAARLSPSSSGVRRYRLFGRTDANAELILYAEAWSRKIQMNMTFEMVREAAKQPHKDPLVTVAIRSDGSVESVTIVQSSGVAAIDDAIRRIVQSQAPYQVFPPGLAGEFDVIEIRRTWYFDMAIRLY
jgi:outer membrane biosynthesis protein TonB